NPEQQKALLKVADDGLILCICECVDNVIRGNIKLTKKKKEDLSKHKNILRKLQDRQIAKDKKRKLLVQNGGFLPALLAPIIGIAGSLIGDLVGGLIKK
ncbi:MAG: hypothetical protein GY795_07445, partial [Desulfobacterales bacterium]|nr:hypothetical protein [Desulfobacterales bacterium]